MENRKNETKQTPHALRKSVLEFAHVMGFRIEDGLAYSPSEERLPGTSKGRASDALGAAIQVAAELGIGNEEAFLDLVFNPMWSGDEMSGNIQLQLLEEAEKMTGLDGAPLDPAFKHRSVQVSTLLVACAYAIQSLKAEGDSSVAWTLACEASHWLGIVQGSIAGKSMGKEIGKSAFGKAGANARHAENRKLKLDVFEWCETNMRHFKSMDKAAEAIHGKLVPVGFRTAREWIGDWNKSQSAGRA